MNNINQLVQQSERIKRYSKTLGRCVAIVDVYCKVVDGREFYFYTAEISQSRDIITLGGELICRHQNHFTIASQYAQTKDQIEMVEEKEIFDHQITCILRDLNDRESCPF